MLFFKIVLQKSKAPIPPVNSSLPLLWDCRSLRKILLLLKVKFCLELALESICEFGRCNFYKRQRRNIKYFFVLEEHRGYKNQLLLEKGCSVLGKASKRKKIAAKKDI